MSTETPPTQPTIAELWGEFAELSRIRENGLETAKRWSIAMGKPMKQAIEMNLRTIQPKWESLRQQLLERCDNDRACDGRHVSLTFEGDGIVSLHTAAIVRMNANDLNNLAARLLFMAWEIEQLAKEATNG